MGFIVGLVVVATLGAQWLQVFHLPAGAEYRFVGCIQLGKLFNGGIGLGEGCRFVKHELAEEFVQGAEVFGRLSFV